MTRTHIINISYRRHGSDNETARYSNPSVTPAETAAMRLDARGILGSTISMPFIPHRSHFLNSTDQIGRHVRILPPDILLPYIARALWQARRR
jgi:hypothetical protein